ncbi:carbohydrate kinase family protein [Hallella bergensis]|uniref:carbohydrate kinase family protein n=1 Tax=Hallella bergensis TaxID=242750 RepID=UPI0039905927
MRKVIGIGETVFDIIFKDGQPIGAYPGGSSFNAMISLGRAGIPGTFISETGNDRVGQRVIAFLRENGINADHVNVFPDSKTPISLAFLNENNDAEYIFYKNHPNDRLEFVYPEIQRDDIVVFGSFYAINPVIRPQMVALLEDARKHGAIIYYDVNFRPSHRHEVMKVTPNLLENLEYADIVRGSHEDFEVLYKLNDCDMVYNSEVSFYCKRFIYTQGSRPVELRAENGLKKSYAVETSETVSNIGAGDNFNAGFIYGLLKYGITRDRIERGLTEEEWDSLIACGQEFSANCCKSLLNYVSKEFGESKRLER